MNLLGAIGTLMNGSWVSEVSTSRNLRTKMRNAFQQMLPIKAVSQAIRGHIMIVDAALSTLQVADDFPRNEDGSLHELVKQWLLFPTHK